MAEIKNTFLQGRMNQDIDARLIPQGEYRAAVNLLISRSEGATVGEFENILGNSELSSTVKGLLNNIIGVHVDDVKNVIYTFNTNFPLPGQTSERADDTNDCYIQRLDLNSNTSSIIVDGYWLNFSRQKPINQTNLVEDLLFWTDDFNQPRRINVTSAFNSPSYYFTESQISVARYYPYEALIPMERQTVIVSDPKGTSSDTEIFITVPNDKIKYGDIVTANDKTEPSTSVIQNSIPPVRVVKVVSDTEFKVWPPIQPGSLPDGARIDFSRTTMENRADKYNPNFSIQDISDLISNDQIKIGGDLPSGDPGGWEMGGFPRIGDLVRLISGGAGSIVPDNLRIKHISFAVGNATTNPPTQTGLSAYTLTLSEDINTPTCTLQVGDKISIGDNENYDVSFDGDTKYLDDKFVRFSYRFRFVENEYSLIAPFSQIMFIPKQKGQFNLGQTNTLTEAKSNSFQSEQRTEIYNYYQDETDAYTSTILEWFENNVDSIDLKIPLPFFVGSNKTNIIQQVQERFQINSIDILYKESDAESIKVLDTLDLSLQTEDKIESIQYDDDINGLTNRLYLKYSYTSNKPYKTLPQDQTTRVYDKVPIKALSQELISNRIVYGNYLQGMTPPSSIEYSAGFSPRDMQTSDYATQYPFSNVKQNRTYQVGFVLADYYGRQSDVILSTLDQIEEFKGSTVYVPYRTASDAIDEPVIDWLGRNLTLDISEEIATEINPSQGKPGIYKEDGHVVNLSITNAGANFVANKTYSTITTGNGKALTIRVTEVDGLGAIESFIIVTSGSGYEVGDTIGVPSLVFGSDAELEITQTGAANPLGWYTYKVVVKQQEQEYYNVFLPGFVNGLPICDQLWNGIENQTIAGTGANICPDVNPIQTERGKIAFATLLSENVNKIPRSLDEVGPTDLEFNSDEVLFIRVNNPNVTVENAPSAGPITSPYIYPRAINSQYYPDQLQQNVLTIETVRESELQAIPFKKFRTTPNRAVWPYVTDEVTNHSVPCTQGVGGFGSTEEYVQKSGFQGEYNSEVLVADSCFLVSSPPTIYGGNVFSVSSGSIPWGDVGDTAPFYGADQNPFIMKIGQVTNYENPIGAIVAGPPLTPQGCGGVVIPHDTNWPTVDEEPGLRSMRPILSIAETKPVFSLLDIFWESTLSGKLEILNSSISSNYNGVVGCSINSLEFNENQGSPASLTPLFNFTNGSGSTANATSVSIVSLYSQQSPNVQLVPANYFEVVSIGGPNNEFQMKTTSDYWFRETSTNPGSDVYIASLQVESTSGAESFTDILTDAITIKLNNAAPEIYNDSGYSNNVTGTTITIPSNPDYPVAPPITISEILTLWGLNGSADSNNYKKELNWEVQGVLGTPTTDFELIAGPDEGSVILKNTIELVADTPYLLKIIVKDANEGTGSLSAEVDVEITFGTQPAPKSISTPPSVWSNSNCTTKYEQSHYPAFGGVMQYGEFRFTNVSAQISPQGCAPETGIFNVPPNSNPNTYYCFNVCQGTPTSIFPNDGGFDDEAPPVGCPATEKGRGDLFQGTLDLKIFTQRITDPAPTVNDMPTTEFVVQYRANSGDAWSYIDSVPVTKAGMAGSIYDSTAPIVVLAPQKSSNDPKCTSYGIRYKFDQLGEYRVVCSTRGPNPTTWGWYIDYADGTYNVISDACEPA